MSFPPCDPKGRNSPWAAPDLGGKFAYRLPNFSGLEQVPAEDLFINGSFEIPEGARALRLGQWGLGHLPSATDPALWRKHWRLDQQVGRHGSASLCIENSPGLPLLRAVAAWVSPPKSVPQISLSAWLKSDQDALLVVLQFGSRSAKTDVGRE